MNKLICRMIEQDREGNYSIVYKFVKKIWNTTSKILPSKLYLKIIHRLYLGKKLNLKNPQTLNEKIQWKKIYDKNPLYTKLADKYSIRDYIKENIGEKYLIPLLYNTNNPKDIPFDKIPLPYIIKVNNGSGQVIILKDKKEINQREIIKKCCKWVNSNIYWVGREPQYKNIKPRIIIEKLLLDEKFQIPKDYKFHCFNGKVEFIQVDKDRFENHKRSLFDINWKLMPFNWGPKKNNKYGYLTIKDVKKPKNLKEMTFIAEALSKDFDYIRVDLYSVKNKVYFGELTFHPAGGIESFFPDKYDLIYGKKLKLKGFKKNNLISSSTYTIIPRKG